MESREIEENSHEITAVKWTSFDAAAVIEQKIHGIARNWRKISWKVCSALNIALMLPLLLDQQIHWKRQIHWITNMKKRRDIIQFEIIIIAVFTMEPKYFESRV